jgi:hypothetical protein
MGNAQVVVYGSSAPTVEPGRRTSITRRIPDEADNWNSLRLLRVHRERS